MDEATSAVDGATDALIQDNIRREFAGATMLVVAHRLATVVDFDKVLVLDNGEAVEYGSPRELWGEDGLQRERWGVFRRMCEGSGDAEQLKAVIIGK